MVHEIFPHHLDNQFHPREIQPTDMVVIFSDKHVLVQGNLGDNLILPQYQSISDQVAPEALRFLFTIDDTGYYLLWDKLESFSPDLLKSERRRSNRSHERSWRRLDFPFATFATTKVSLGG